MLAAYLLGVGAIVLGIICGMNALLVLLNGVDETEHFGRSVAWSVALAVIAAAFIGGGLFIFKF
jgi:hypothetical protein